MLALAALCLALVRAANPSHSSLSWVTAERVFFMLLIALLLTRTSYSVADGGPGPASGGGKLLDKLTAEDLYRRPHVSARASNFSSFECAGGSQKYDGLPLLKPRLPNVPIDDPSWRVCIFRDVCMVDGELTYYVDPAAEEATPPNLRMSSFSTGVGTGLFYLGFIDYRMSGISMAPNTVAGARPPELKVHPDDRLFVLDDYSFVGTFSHVLIDHVMAAYSAAELFGADVADLQFVGKRTCEQIAFGDAAACRRNTAAWFPIFSRHKYLEAPVANQCFRRIVAGHVGPFNCDLPYLHRATSSRAMRMKALQAVGISAGDLPTAHLVLVFVKVQEMSDIGLPRLCDDAKSWAGQLSPPPAVKCIAPKDMTIREQIDAIRHATVTFTEHGSTSYGALFQTPGSCIIVINPEGPIDLRHTKEVQVLNFVSDVQAFYSSKSKMTGGEGPGTLLVAIEHAGRRFNLPPVALRST